MDSSSARPVSPASEPLGRTGPWLLLVLIPALGPLWLIASFGVNLPYWDQWMSEVPTLLAHAGGTLGMADLLLQDNDSRGALPRLVRIALAGPTGYDLRYQMAVSVLATCLGVLALHVLVRQTTSASRSTRLLLLGFASVLLFGLPHQQNWLWGINFSLFIVLASLVAALAAAGSCWRGAVRTAVCAALCTGAMFSFASGVLLWPLVLVALIWPVRAAPPLGRAALGGFLAAAAAAFFLYFHDYQPLTRWAGEELNGPVGVLHFVVTFLGAPLGKGVWSAPDAASTAFGAVLVALFLVAAGYVAVRRDRDLARAALPWVLMAGFAVGSGSAAALYRTVPGAERYLATSVYFVVALAVLAWIVVEDAARRQARWQGLGRIALACGLLGVLGLHFLASWTAYWRADVSRTRRLQGKAALAWILVVPEPDLLVWSVSPYLDILTPRAEGLDRAGWLDPPLVRDDRVEAVVGPSGGATGELVDATWEGDELLVTVRARLRGRDEPADAVLLCRSGQDGGEPRVFALAWERRPDGEAAGYLEAGADSDVDRFVRRLPAERVPGGAWSLTAWAYDALAGVAYPLDDAVPMPR